MPTIAGYAAAASEMDTGTDAEAPGDTSGAASARPRSRAGGHRGKRAAVCTTIACSVGLAGLVLVRQRPSETSASKAVPRGSRAVGITEFAEASTCSEGGESCIKSQCCLDETHRCFEKNKFWATCRPTCDPGVDSNDQDAMPWSCRMLGIDGIWDYHAQQAKNIVKNMSVVEKVSMLRGENSGWPADRHGYAGYVGVGRTYEDPWMAKGIMPLSMNDGPQGYNSYAKFDSKSTQYPSLLTVAASFSTATARNYAAAIAEEFVAKGANVLLGPDVEVLRAPLAGRSFETISGEDPFLGATLVPAYIKAVQDHGIIVCVKHFLNNNQEIYRQSMNVEVGDRAQHEIYLPVFKSAFDSGANAVMCSYNRVYGHFACENDKLLSKLLREALGFRGFVVSDWGATHDAMKSAKAGLDIDMQKDDPKVLLRDEYHKLPKLLEDGNITEESINEKVVHVLSSMGVSGLFNGRFSVPSSWPTAKMGIQRGEQKKLVQADTTSDAHRAVAYQTIIDGAVLLKNNGGALPLAKDAKVVMVGKYCNQAEDEAIKQGSVYSGGGSGFVGTDKTVTPLAGLKAVRPVTASFDASGAEGADIAVVCVAAHSEEGWDRKTLDLPEAKELVSALRAQSPGQKIVVVASTPGAVLTEWVEEADAAMVLFMPGEQVGPALAALLTGAAAPAGRLPVSFPTKQEKRFTSKQYPGECPPPKYWCPEMTANFTEGVLVGYRWNDAEGVVPAFPFGFGLTYTDFELKNFRVTCEDEVALVSLDIKNVGGRDGTAVPQVYIGFDSLKPVVRQLRGFQKVQVAKGETAKAAFQFHEADWSAFDEASGDWVNARAKGERIHISVGTSSADLVWHGDIPEKCSSSKDKKPEAKRDKDVEKADEDRIENSDGERADVEKAEDEKADEEQADETKDQSSEKVVAA